MEPFLPHPRQVMGVAGHRKGSPTQHRFGHGSMNDPSQGDQRLTSGPNALLWRVQKKGTEHSQRLGSEGPVGASTRGNRRLSLVGRSRPELFTDRGVILTGYTRLWCTRPRNHKIVIQKSNIPDVVRFMLHSSTGVISPS